MKLHDILINTDEEITVWDKNYDIEIYFYGIGYVTDVDGTIDRWDKALLSLSKLVEVVESSDNGYTVNLSEVIENKLNELEVADLFFDCNIDAIMDDMMNILAGNVSEEWLEKFVAVLKEGAEND